MVKQFNKWDRDPLRVTELTPETQMHPKKIHIRFPSTGIFTNPNPNTWETKPSGDQKANEYRISY